MIENTADCESQNGKAKSEIVAQVARIIRKAGLDYEGWRYIAKQVRKACELRPAKKGRRLPRILTAADFRKFYEVVDRADDVQHALMLRLLFFTGVRVSELCSIQVADVDLENCKIRINSGKGDKDRYVLFGKTFATALRTHVAAHPNNRWLFQTTRKQQVHDTTSSADCEAVCGASRRDGDTAHVPTSVHHLADSEQRLGRCRTSIDYWSCST